MIQISEHFLKTKIGSEMFGEFFLSFVNISFVNICFLNNSMHPASSQHEINSITWKWEIYFCINLKYGRKFVGSFQGICRQNYSIEDIAKEIIASKPGGEIERKLGALIPLSLLLIFQGCQTEMGFEICFREIRLKVIWLGNLFDSLSCGEPLCSESLHNRGT